MLLSCIERIYTVYTRFAARLSIPRDRPFRSSRVGLMCVHQRALPSISRTPGLEQRRLFARGAFRTPFGTRVCPHVALRQGMQTAQDFSRCLEERRSYTVVA
jgi:hypothetical protein